MKCAMVTWGFWALPTQSGLKWSLTLSSSLLWCLDCRCRLLWLIQLKLLAAGVPSRQAVSFKKAGRDFPMTQTMSWPGMGVVCTRKQIPVSTPTSMVSGWAWVITVIWTMNLVVITNGAFLPGCLVDTRAPGTTSTTGASIFGLLTAAVGRVCKLKHY